MKKAEHIAGEVTKALTGAGLWGVEFFLSKQGEVIFSELSPRPHDTGMVTLGHTTNLSEFELHFRAVMGLPIAGIHLEHIGCSAVILSPEESTEPLNYNMLDALKEDHTRIRIFGKPEAHVGRRMGVVLCYGEKGDDLNQAPRQGKAPGKDCIGNRPIHEEIRHERIRKNYHITQDIRPKRQPDSGRGRDAYSLCHARTYWTYDVPGGESRGGHAHKECQEFIIAASGSFSVTLDNGEQKKTYHLNHPWEGLFVDVNIWRTLDDFSSGSLCLVLASQKFEEEDYIREYDEYLRYARHHV